MKNIAFPVWLESLLISLAIATLEAGIGYATSGAPVTLASLLVALGAGGANYMTSWERSHSMTTTQMVEQIVNAIVAGVTNQTPVAPVTVNVQGQSATAPVEVVNPAPVEVVTPETVTEPVPPTPVDPAPTV